MQKREDKVNENKGQERIRWMFTDNLIEIKEEEKQDWGDSGKDNEELGAGI